MTDLYRESILDHYKNPRNFGHLQGANVKHEATNPSCGDAIAMEVKIGRDRDGNRIIEDVAFSGQGCAINIASASMLTERVKGARVSEVMELGRADIEGMLGTVLTPSRVKCAVLPLESLHRALGS